MVNNIKFYADMLDFRGDWCRYAFSNDFVFEKNYVKGKDLVQIWLGKDKEMFIFKNVELV